MSDVELPRGIALAWGIAVDPQRGPKRELSVEKIVDAAIEIADADGLGAVSMSSVATRLGYTTMSLYRYVSAKDDLIVLMNDEGLGLPPDHEPVDDDWRGGLRRWGRAVDAAYRRHPWLLDIPIDGVPITPNNLAWLDWGLRLLAPAGMAASNAVAAVLMISGLTRWQATIDRSVASGDQLEAEQVVFTELVTPERYPALAAALRDGGLSDDEADDPFRFALERALDGLECVVGSVGVPPAPVEPVEPESVRGGQVDDVEVPRDARIKEATRIRREAEAKVREAENRLRDARYKESELIAKARQRAAAAAARG
ncbi:MAG TPA: TetR/AcrR family transcriptional regulator [Microlunatus sp.]|nr:TetR/AcrR family transcriptional regulator [Microlunatus sp.]